MRLAKAQVGWKAVGGACYDPAQGLLASQFVNEGMRCYDSNRCHRGAGPIPDRRRTSRNGRLVQRAAQHVSSRAVSSSLLPQGLKIRHRNGLALGAEACVDCLEIGFVEVGEDRASADDRMHRKACTDLEIHDQRSRWSHPCEMHDFPAVDDDQEGGRTGFIADFAQIGLGRVGKGLRREKLEPKRHHLRRQAVAARLDVTDQKAILFQRINQAIGCGPGYVQAQRDFRQLLLRVKPREQLQQRQAARKAGHKIALVDTAIGLFFSDVDTCHWQL